MPPRLRLTAEQKQVIRHLRVYGPTPRSELAEQMGASHASLTKISRELLGLGLIEELNGTDARGRGRPAVPLRVSASGGYAVGAAVLTGTLDVALVDFAGNIIVQAAEPFDSSDPRVFCTVVQKRVHQFAETHHLLGRRLLGVGIGIPGYRQPFQEQRWHVVESLAPWRNLPLRQLMQDEFDLPVWIENDANSAVLAEYYLGGLLQKSVSNIAVILLGHGIGAGILSDGRLLIGETGKAGEVGAFYPSYPRPSTLDLIATLRHHGSTISSISDFEATVVGYDFIISQWIVRAAKQLEPIIRSALLWLEPGAIVISSPLPREIVVRLAQHLNNVGILEVVEWENSLEVQVSELGGSAVALGAALLPIHDSASI